MFQIWVEHAAAKGRIHAIEYSAVRQLAKVPLSKTSVKAVPGRTTKLFIASHVWHESNQYIAIEYKVWILALFLIGVLVLANFLAFVFLLVGLLFTQRVELHVAPKAGEQLNFLFLDFLLSCSGHWLLWHLTLRVIVKGLGV